MIGIKSKSQMDPTLTAAAIERRKRRALYEVQLVRI